MSSLKISRVGKEIIFFFKLGRHIQKLRNFDKKTEHFLFQFFQGFFPIFFNFFFLSPIRSQALHFLNFKRVRKQIKIKFSRNTQRYFTTSLGVLISTTK